MAESQIRRVEAPQLRSFAPNAKQFYPGGQMHNLLLEKKNNKYVFGHDPDLLGLLQFWLPGFGVCGVLFKGLLCRFHEFEAEFDVYPLLKFEVHSEITNEHVNVNAKMRFILVPIFTARRHVKY